MLLASELFVGLILVAVVFEIYVIVVGTRAGVYYEVIGFGIGCLRLRFVHNFPLIARILYIS